MHVWWALVLIALSSLAWGGQTVAWLAPGPAARLGLTEPEDSVEPTFWADLRGEAAWDFLTLWTGLAAGLLLLVESSAWPYFGLAGGGMYLYFAGRGVFTRLAMQRRGLRIGLATNAAVAYTFLTLWGVMGLVTIAAAVVELS